MKYKELAKKLSILRTLEKKEGIITSGEIKECCLELGVDYKSAVNYLLSNKYLERIFRGIFYINSLEERKTGVPRISYFLGVSKAMEIRKISNWYFGLESALKLNRLTHEAFLVETIINDKTKNSRPVLVLGRKTKLTKVSAISYSFGIIEKASENKVKIFYSDTERTLLDMAFLLRYNRRTISEIRNVVSGYSYERAKLERYLKHYPKTIAEVFK
ncbi:MAG TPA: hypothetical protein ENN46_03675 [Candidatus Woesearchaeota archaeon]|nr:hypothetical protein [Candidatus Woesearchaeota archaeon]